MCQMYPFAALQLIRDMRVTHAGCGFHFSTRHTFIYYFSCRISGAPAHALNKSPCAEWRTIMHVNLGHMKERRFESDMPNSERGYAAAG